MVKLNSIAPTNSQHNHKIWHKSDLAILSERTYGFKEVDELRDEQLLSKGNRNFDSQARRLSDPRMQTAQCQVLAKQIGALQGNLGLQRILVSASGNGNQEIAHKQNDEWQPSPAPNSISAMHANLQKVTLSQPSLQAQAGQLSQPYPRQPQPLAAIPARRMSQLPQNVRANHNAHIAANDLDGALQVVVQYMETQGEIDPNLIGTPTATQRGAEVCRNHSTTYIVGPALGASALTTKCDCSGVAGNSLPNVRIQIGPRAIHRIETLHSTLFHEFRHVLQEHEACNQSSGGARVGGVCTDCNQPEEMDAYLAELEGGYDPQSISNAWVRVYTNWPWLAYEQQAIFMPRQVAARRKVDSIFPNFDWANDPRVIRYSRWCKQLNSRVNGNVADYCDNPMAPLKSSGSLPGLPIPEPIPKGDFPVFDRNRRLA